MLPHVTATRYVVPLREGGSLPGLMEADDLGTYVVKFVGAGQGRKALVAEVVTGTLGRGLGLPVPDLVTVEVDAALAAGEPDEEVQDLLRRSGGLNLGMDYLPGALDFDPGAFPVPPALAGRVLWFDALVGNADRSWRNPNLLYWHGRVHLIDHGATLTFHHSWAGARRFVARPYDAGEHALIGCRPDVAAADAELGPLVTPELLAAAVGAVPARWLVDEPGFADLAAVRAAYVDLLLARLVARPDWLPPLAAVAAAGGGGWRRPYAQTAVPPGLARPAGRGAAVRHVFEYAVLRVVPRVDRGESMNAGVLLYCRPLDYLGSRVHLDVARLLALDPGADPSSVDRALRAAADVCAAAPAAGPPGREDQGRRFRWLTAPRSTVVQPGPVHTGLTGDPDGDADRLLRLLVLPL